jgi:predicted ATP-grasp superfamily ATP-dependent carboligase
VVSAPRVLVTDAEHRSVLAACRGLASAGYRVSTVASERFAVGNWSRFSRENVRLTGPHADPEGYVERLAEVAKSGRYDILVAGTDAAMLAISAGRRLIEPHARLGLPPHEVILQTQDKQLLQREAARAGLAAPTSIQCSRVDDVFEAARELGFPVVVKPARSVVRERGRLRQLTARVVTDAAELQPAVRSAGLPLTVQEYLPAARLVSCAGVRIESRLLGLTVARYARTYPSPVGSAALAETGAAPAGLAERVEKLLAKLEWIGMFELELLQLEDGRFAAIDLNPRPFGWLALAIGAGANLPALWCDHVLGRSTVSPFPARPGVSYRWEDADARNAVAELRRLRPRAAASVLRPRRRVVHAHFRLDDPGPFVARMLAWAR